MEFNLFLSENSILLPDAEGCSHTPSCSGGQGYLPCLCSRCGYSPPANSYSSFKAQAPLRDFRHSPPHQRPRHPGLRCPAALTFISVTGTPSLSPMGITGLWCPFIPPRCSRTGLPEASARIVPPVAFCSLSGSSLLCLWLMHWTLQLTNLGAEA